MCRWPLQDDPKIVALATINEYDRWHERAYMAPHISSSIHITYNAYGIRIFMIIVHST